MTLLHLFLNALLELLYKQAGFHWGQQRCIAQLGSVIAGSFCLLWSQKNQTRNSLLLYSDWGSKLVFVSWGKILSLFTKRHQLWIKERKGFFILHIQASSKIRSSSYTDFLKWLLLPCHLSALCHLLSNKEQCSAANSLLMIFFNWVITSSMMSLFLFGGWLRFDPVSFSWIFQWRWSLTAWNALITPLPRMPKAKGFQPEQLLETHLAWVLLGHTDTLLWRISWVCTVYAWSTT